MKLIILLTAMIIIATTAFATDCNTVTTHLKKAVPMASARMKVLSCKEIKSGDSVIYKGIYSTPLTERTGEHIPYEAFYKNGELEKI